MNTVDEAHRKYGISKKLINSVIRQLGDKGEELASTLSDIASHGADSGWSGFTYYTDTVKFFKRNRADILAMAKSQASDSGTTVIAMVKGFKCAADADEDSIARCLYGSMKKSGDAGDSDTLVANCLAWYALEEVARAMTED